MTRQIFLAHPLTLTSYQNMIPWDRKLGYIASVGNISIYSDYSSRNAED